MVKVNYVEARDDYKLFIKLYNGKSWLFDVKPYLDKGIFTEFKDQNYFKSVTLGFGVITWPHHEQDFSADTIEYEMQKNQ
jgi:hypothetical protein